MPQRQVLPVNHLCVNLAMANFLKKENDSMWTQITRKHPNILLPQRSYCDLPLTFKVIYIYINTDRRPYKRYQINVILLRSKRDNGIFGMALSVSY